MATYAIGDIQGCFKPFQELLRLVGFTPGTDRLWVVGDVVNRGPKSLKVLRWLHKHQDHVDLVLGNHDLHLLAVDAGVRTVKGRDTFQDVLDAPDKDELLAYLSEQPLLHHVGDRVMFHAGLLPSWTLDEAAERAVEAAAALQGPKAKKALKGLYDSGDLSRVAETLQTLTRLRYVDRQGRPTEGHMGPSVDGSDDCIPWFAAPGRPSRPACLVFGHWSTLGLHMTSEVCALDSGCVYGRYLSAVRLEDRAVFQVLGQD
ncbi:MAG: symmetrical bis(5'-nucleosyl)-tetraphosphatase [Planctomycetes bacterium]|nr:symmetrical bis(5'-nucleosyl)-tetraphosphatase [Planctomycetota bacterium]